MIAAPFFPVSTPTPSWAGLETDGGRIVHRIDARGGGLYGGVTPQTLIPHGETASVLSSAMVKSDATSTANGYEGIGHSLQGFVRGPTGSAVRVYDNNILTNGDPAQWINETFDEYRRVTFIDQMPDNVSPEWLQSTWFTKCITGQTRFANLEFRDHYSRRYKFHVDGTDWGTSVFSMQTNEGMIAGRDVSAFNHYMDTLVAPIAKGQNISVELSAYIDFASILGAGGVGQLPMIAGIGLKFTRVSDGGADWWGTAIGASANVIQIEGELVERSESFAAKNAYRQVETVVWVVHRGGLTSAIGEVAFQHEGIDINININDALETGA